MNYKLSIRLSFVAIKLFAFLVIATFVIPPPIIAEERAMIKIAVLPLKMNTKENIDYVRDALYDMVSSRLSVERSIIVLKESDVLNVFSKYEKEKAADDLLKKIGRELNADYVLYGSLTYIPDTLSLDVKVLSIKREEPPIQSTSQGKGLESLIPIVSQIALDLNARILEREGLQVTVEGFGAAPSYAGGFTKKGEKKEETDEFIITTRDRTKERQLWKSHTFASLLKKMDIADVDADGRNEIVMIDEHNLYIYRVRGQVMELVREFKGEVYENNYSIDAADLNGNNIPEIYVSMTGNSGVESYAIEYQSGEFVKIAKKLPWFLKVVETPNKETFLLGQKMSRDGIFSRDVKHLVWQKEGIIEKAGIDMPVGLNIYNFVKITIDEKDYAVAYTERDYLKLYKRDDSGRWQEVWTSPDYLGGTLNRIELGGYRKNTGGSEAFDFIDIKSRIIYGDYDSDGRVEIVVNKNEGGTLSRYFKKGDSYKYGEIIDLSWEKGGFEENWKTRKLDGYISDFIIKDFDNDGQKDLVMIVVEGSGTHLTKSYLTAYKLNIR